MNESKFWGWLKGRLPSGFYTRIESPISPGIPDVYYTLDDFDSGWLELKIGGPGRYPFKGERRGLRPAQVVWGRELTLRHGKLLIVAYIAPTVVVWRLKPAQFDPFNHWNIETLRHHSVYWCDRKLVRCIEIKSF